MTDQSLNIFPAMHLAGPDAAPAWLARAFGLTSARTAGALARTRPSRVAAQVVSTDQARSLALALPQATERDHHGRPSFRVAGRIFATLWDESHMNVRLGQPGILTAVHSEPRACAEFWWGKRLRAVSVDLPRASAEMLADLLKDAWESKAPKHVTDKRG